MNTRKLALLSTMLVGLGGVALAQDATTDPADPLLPPDQSTEGQQQTPGAGGDAGAMDGTTASPGAGGDTGATGDMGATGGTTAPDAGGDTTAPDAMGGTGDSMGDTGTGGTSAPGTSGDASTPDTLGEAPPEGGIESDAGAPDTGLAADPGAPSPSVGSSTDYSGTVLDGMLADELIGMNVVDAAGDSVGTVSDLLIGADNAVDRAILDVGGFLGFGTKAVALDITRLTVAQGDGEVVVDVTREELDAMPEWQQEDGGWFVTNE